MFLKKPLQMSVIKESLGEMNDTHWQGDGIDGGTQGLPSPFQVRTTKEGIPDRRVSRITGRWESRSDKLF